MGPEYGPLPPVTGSLNLCSILRDHVTTLRSEMLFATGQVRYLGGGGLQVSPAKSVNDHEHVLCSML